MSQRPCCELCSCVQLYVYDFDFVICKLSDSPCAHVSLVVL